jgi:alkylation response protein AidB-like acyl-CoA dehydrogenase
MFGINPVIKHGSEAMRRKYIPRVVSGELNVCFSVTEPDAGTDTTRITTRAVRKGDSYVINGRKTWMTKASESQKVLLLTRTTPLAECARRTDGMTLFLADMDPRHVTIKPIRKLGRHAVSSNDVFIDDLVVPVEDRVGEEGKGVQIPSRRAQSRTDPRGVRGHRRREGRVESRRAIRRRAQRLRPTYRSESGYSTAPGRFVRAARGG